MPEIGGYGFGRVTIDGREETGDVIVLPERIVRGRWRQTGHGLVLDEVLPTADAVQRSTQLDPRTTAAALHLTC